MAALQTSGQIAEWLHWQGFPIASPAALGRNSRAFRAAVRRYADGNQFPWVVFRKGDRKLGSGTAVSGCRGERRAVGGGGDRGGPRVPVDLRRDEEERPGRVPWLKFYRTERLVTCYYFYIHDGAGAAFIKVCCYAPYPVKVWVL